MLGSLLRFLRKVVEGVLSQLTQLFQQVEEMALAPVRAIISEVVGGKWIGNGANAFVDELSSIVIPGVGNVNQNISTFSKNLTNAQERIDQADQEVMNLVQNRLTDTFKFY